MKRILNQSYNKKNEQLNLWNRPLQWVNVLNDQNWQQIKILKLGHCQISHIKIKVFFVKEWPNLKQLYLTHNTFGLLGVKYLIKINFPALEKLSIGNCLIGDESIRVLTKGKWPKLTLLSIYGNHINSDGIQKLNQANWPELSSLINYNFNTLTLLQVIPIQSSKIQLSVDEKKITQIQRINVIVLNRFKKKMG